jgi:two-component system response regulator FixJ
MSHMKPVYIVDDDSAVRESVAVAIEIAGYDVLSFATATEFLKIASTLAHGCLVLDVKMPVMNGLELQERLVGCGLHFPTIVMTGDGDIAMAVRAMKAGAIDFIEKPFAAEDLIERIEDSFRESTRAAPDGAAAGKLSLLSARERQVLEGVVAGLPNKTIAYDLGLSPRTVEVYRARLMEKMKASTLPELVRLAFSAGVTPSHR